MNESYLLFINNETSLSNQSLVRFFLSYDLKLSVEKELDKTQGIFPMSFSGSLLKSGIEDSWKVTLKYSACHNLKRTAI